MSTSRPKHLVLAAALTGVGGLALVVLGWWIVGWEYRGDWGRLTDFSWWVGGVLRGLGFLAYGKAGLKIALGCVAAVVAALAWLRSRRHHRAAQPEPDAATE
ncbi:hypothetical protein [Cryptosporangium minutisporangium]|uniref:Uncharacterized protein n=1 Tax=Cryptosporangium minutisporangium TaxID=113569 RepID=A0ABP6SSN4_9ACTN